jgi:signal transduction protein with GAF and PtsI domain
VAEIRIDSEQVLVHEILQSVAYKEFKAKQLQPKIDREKRAWRLILEHRGQFTREALNQVFDVVDHFEGNKRWFGSLLAVIRLARPASRLIRVCRERLSVLKCLISIGSSDRYNSS